MEDPECMDIQPPLATMRLSEEGVMNLERELHTYSKLVVACNNRVQMMHSLSFNKEQCQYLVHTLKEVIESSSAILKPSHDSLIESYAPTEVEKLHLSMKLLFVLAMEIERFIGGCSQDAWVPFAMTLTNVSEFVSSMGFHLELCRVALSKECEASGDLNLDQVANISKHVNEIVKTKASMDKEDLLRKISLALPSLHGDKKDLASYLLQRVLNVTLESKKVSSRYLTSLRSIFEKVKQGVSIGRGSSATVYKAKWLAMEVAIKVFYGENNPEFQKEVDVLAQLRHPNITSMFCCTKERRKCSIVMELMDGDLFALMQQRLEKNPKSPPFNIWEAIDLMHQIAEGGKYLHEQGVVHRDLKSHNILVKSVKTPSLDLELIQAKVADFNVSKIKKGSTTHSVQTMNVGTNRWMAPELMKLLSMGDPMNVEGSNAIVPKYPKKCDIYSFAMVCYEILTGELPFSAYSHEMAKKMKAMILEGGRPELPIHCPRELRDLIEKCWNLDPESRPTFDDICRELKFVKYSLMAGTSSMIKVQDTFKKGHIEKAPNHALKDNDDNLEDGHNIDIHFSSNTSYFNDHVEVKTTVGKHGDALEDLNKANELEPNHAFTLRECGVVYRMMGKHGDALEDLNKANELEPNVAFTLSERGVVYKMMGKYGDALKDLTKANELEPNDAFTLRERGVVYRMMGKYGDALEDLNKANELEPNVAFTLSERGVVYKMMGKYGDALKDLNKANELEPNDAFTLRERGVVYRMMGKYGDALEDLNKANGLEPNVASTLRERGVVYRLMGKHGDALEDLSKANELEPNVASTLRERGVVYRLMGNHVDALKDLNKAIELEPSVVFTLSERGVVYRMMGKHGDALEDLNKANELEPNDAFTLKERGLVYRMMGKYGDALEDLNKANGLEPNVAFTSKQRGVVYLMMGKYGDALEDLNKANELEPNDAFTLKERRVVYRMMGKHGDALEDLNKANELEPNVASTLRERGVVYRMMGNHVDALEDLNKAIELEPSVVFTLSERGVILEDDGQTWRCIGGLD